MKTDLWIIYLHLGFVIPALILGPIILFRPKGDPLHKSSGKIWVVLMFLASLVSLGIRHQGQFSWLHGLAVFTIYSVINGWNAARNGAIESHRRSMVGAYIGSAIAFLFSMHPERLLGGWLRSFF
jgi:uncharacterized membrane protein